MPLRLENSKFQVKICELFRLNLCPFRSCYGTVDYGFLCPFVIVPRTGFVPAVY